MSKNNKKTDSTKPRVLFQKIHIAWALVIAIVVSIIYFIVTAPRIADSEIESYNGIHYHPHLVIHINGENISIPKGVGLEGPVESPIHVHEDDNIIHLEFTGKVKKSDIMLGKFFDVWQKEWTATSFMGHPIDANHKLIMKVNGVETTLYREYVMKDKDEIELSYQ